MLTVFVLDGFDVQGGSPTSVCIHFLVVPFSGHTPMELLFIIFPEMNGCVSVRGELLRFVPRKTKCINHSDAGEF